MEYQRDRGINHVCWPNGCEAFSWILKRWLKEERPVCTFKISGSLRTAWGLSIRGLHVDNIVMHGKGYGMPSSHAQFVAFFSVFLTLFLLSRHEPYHHAHASSTHIPTPYWQRLLLSVISMVCAAAVAQSRIYLNYHRPRQVYVGVLAGAFCAVAWFVVTTVARRYGVVECF